MVQILFDDKRLKVKIATLKDHGYGRLTIDYPHEEPYYSRIRELITYLLTETSVSQHPGMSNDSR